MDGCNIASVQFGRSGKIYDFSYNSFALKVGDAVVVETDRGVSLASIVKLSYRFPGEELRHLKPILRKASPEELVSPASPSPEDVNKFTELKVQELKLNMRILKSEVQFGGNKIIIYFSSPGRVDFRDLVKELAGGLKSRVELKQVGARDETKLLGGIGICGREYCCSSFLREFIPVSIRMAKNQNLALNPSKISGGCGRLLCCLTYENDVYTELRYKMPSRGARVTILSSGEGGIVQKADLLNQEVLVQTSSGEEHLLKIQDVEVDSTIRPVETKANEDSWGDDIDLKSLNEFI